MSKKDKDGIIEELSGVIGEESAGKFIEYYAGSGIYVPKTFIVKEKHRLIREEYQAGKSYKALSIKYGYTENYIRKIVNKRKRQGYPPPKEV
jgi:Mor family transcriptional regulator